MIKPQRRSTHGTWTLAVLMVLVLCSGCGKKAPPVAPRQAVMAAVANLQVEHQKGRVALTWDHRPSASAVTGYQIYRAGREASLPQCPGCPLLFEKIGTQTLDPDKYGVSHQLIHTHPVAEGFRYTYKVVPIQRSGAQGPDSNLVTVDTSQ